MADFQTQTTEVLPVQDPDNVNADPTQYVKQISPESAGYIDNLTKTNMDLMAQNYQLQNQQAPEKLSRSDIYPTQAAPVTQQGVNGQFLNMPTIAPTGALIPYELIYEQERQKRKEQEKFAKDSAIDLTMTELWNNKANQDYSMGGLSLYQNEAKRYKEVYGDNWAKAMKADPEWNVKWKMYNRMGKIMNETAKSASTILSDKENYTSPKTQKVASDYFNYQEQLIDATKSGDLDEMQKIGEKLNNVNIYLRNATDVQKVLTEASTMFAKSVDKSNPVIKRAVDFLGNPMSSADEKKWAVSSLKANNAFVKEVTDENGNVIAVSFDEDKAKDHYRMLYEAKYSDVETGSNGKYEITSKLDREIKPDPNEFIQMGVDSLAKGYDTSFEDTNTYARVYREQNLGEKNKNQVETIRPEAGFKNYPGIGRLKKVYKYKKTQKITGISVQAKDLNGNQIETTASDEITPSEWGYADNGTRQLVAKKTSYTYDKKTNKMIPKTSTIYMNAEDLGDPFWKMGHYLNDPQSDKLFTQVEGDFSKSTPNEVSQREWDSQSDLSKGGGAITPKGESSTNQPTSTKTIKTRYYNEARNQTKIVYSDGTEKIVYGKQ